MKRIVFLDLEETVIVSWQNPAMINIEKVRAFFRADKVTEVHIFSFAIDNDNDKQHFELSGMRKQIEDMLEIKIVANPSVQEIMRFCRKHTGNTFDMREFKLLWGKMRAFHDFCNANFKGCECWLLDDVVPNTTFTNHDNNTVIRTFQVNSI